MESYLRKKGTLERIWKGKNDEKVEALRVKCTVVDNSQEYRLKYWATRSSVRSFARTAHSWESEFLMSQNDLVLSHSGVTGRRDWTLISSGCPLPELYLLLNHWCASKFTYPIIHSYSHPFIQSFIHTAIHSFIQPFIRSAIHWFIDLFIFLFIQNWKGVVWTIGGVKGPWSRTSARRSDISPKLLKPFKTDALRVSKIGDWGVQLCMATFLCWGLWLIALFPFPRWCLGVGRDRDSGGIK